MSLLSKKADQFDVMVEKSNGLDYANKMVALADKLENKFNKLAQEIETFPAASSSGVNAPYVPGTAPAPSAPQTAAPKVDKATVEMLKAQVDALFAALLK